MADVTVTHIGGPTALIAVDGWRLLTDPTFDPAGERWNFGWGAMSQKLTGPAVSAKDLPPSMRCCSVTTSMVTISITPAEPY